MNPKQFKHLTTAAASGINFQPRKYVTLRSSRNTGRAYGTMDNPHGA